MEEIETIALMFLPTIWEVWNDRNGESKKDKVKDAIITAVMWLILVSVARWLFVTPVVGSLALLIGIRIMFFDYLVQYVLIKRHVIVGHWFTYTGKTAKWDRMIAKINPWVRFALRVAIFSGMIFIYIRTWQH